MCGKQLFFLSPNNSNIFIKIHKTLDLLEAWKVRLFFFLFILNKGAENIRNNESGIFLLLSSYKNWFLMKFSLKPKKKKIPFLCWTFLRGTFQPGAIFYWPSYKPQKRGFYSGNADRTRIVLLGASLISLKFCKPNSIICGLYCSEITVWAKPQA